MQLDALLLTLLAAILTFMAPDLLRDQKHIFTLPDSVDPINIKNTIPLRSRQLAVLKPGKKLGSIKTCRNPRNAAVVIDGLRHANEYLMTFEQRLPLTFAVSLKDLSKHADAVHQIRSSENIQIALRLDSKDLLGFAELGPIELETSALFLLSRFLQITDRHLKVLVTDSELPSHIKTVLESHQVTVISNLPKQLDGKRFIDWIQGGKRVPSLLRFDSHHLKTKRLVKIYRLMAVARRFVTLSDCLSSV